MKKIFSLLLLISVSIISLSQNDGETEYTDGVFIVNEDWYGHQNSTVNFITNGEEWIYRIFQKANPGKELGCTSQFGAIYGGKFYIVSKQEKDPGAKIIGSRLAVCNAKTMKCLKEIQKIATDEKGESIADGRSFLGVNEKKGYVGTSNGIWIYDMETMTTGKQIKGTGNPNSSDYGKLYYAQIGTMIRTEDYVFAIHQNDGLKIIDADADTLIKTIAPPTYYDEKKGKTLSRGFGSIVQSKDGNLWISMAYDVSGNGATMPYLIKMNPYTFKTDTLHIPNDKGIEDVPNSWYAWTADGFCASIQENKIYWLGQNGNSWFKGYRIFCYDIDNNSFSMVYDFEKLPGKWKMYGTGFRIHPITDELYCFMFHEFQDPTHQLARISNKGEMLATYPMIKNYWFPALPVFPDNFDPEVKDIPTIKCKKGGSDTLKLNDWVTDKDNMSVSIVKTLVENTAPTLFDATVKNGKLIIKSLNAKDGAGSVTLRFNSNGKIVDKKIAVKIGIGTGTDNISNDSHNIYMHDNTLFVENCLNYQVAVYDVYGRKVADIKITSNKYHRDMDLPKGIYIVRAIKEADIVTKKVINK
ncbi:MAG: DUF5074 domain-containing protein [Porphyromonadaceae bacterium]|nr:DUF5074 domain-containing protein [Porphyromonadaceae bacterium]